MRRYDSDFAVRDIPFNQATFWVQVHDMPVRFMNKTVAESICDTVGIVCRSIVLQEGLMRRVAVSCVLRLLWMSLYLCAKDD